MVNSKRNTNETVTTTIKVNEAKYLIDKNSKTINKINLLINEQIKLQNQLKLNQNQSMVSSNISPEYIALSQRIERLKQRLDRRLNKLAKWSDISVDERWKDLRSNNMLMNKSLNANKPTVYQPNKPVSANQANALNTINANRAKMLMNQQQATQKAYQNMASIYSNVMSGQLTLPAVKPVISHNSSIINK